MLIRFMVKLLAYTICLHLLAVVFVCWLIAVGTEADPTMPSSTDSGSLVCHDNASLVQQGDVERCVCDPGYSGDGMNCEGKQ